MKRSNVLVFEEEENTFGESVIALRRIMGRTKAPRKGQIASGEGPCAPWLILH